MSAAAAIDNESTASKDLLLTGHEDGSVRFWDVTGSNMTLLCRLRTNEYFQTESTPPTPALDDEDGGGGGGGDTGSTDGGGDNWPPFRKAGTFDPYSDDPRLGVQKLHMCAAKELLVVAGTAGQVLVMHMSEVARELSGASLAAAAHKINIIGCSPDVESHFVWKGHEALALRSLSPTNSSGIKLAAGFQLHALVQLYPPATVSALALHADWQLCGMGTAHGFALFDFAHRRTLLVRCTLDPAALLAGGECGGAGGGMANFHGTISRRKSLKKSLRESFRKLRRGRSQKPSANKQKHASDLATLNANTSSEMRVHHLDADGDDGGHGGHRPIERQVESREFKPVDDIPPSVIRYITFVRTFVTSGHQQTNSMWVGTNTGVIYIYALQFLLNAAHINNSNHQPPQQIVSGGVSQQHVRANQSVNCVLAKEMRLKHRAPVVHIQVIDEQLNPLPLDSSSSTCSPSSTPSNNNNHKVIICSEEQFKVFQLPTLKPVCKFKLTAVEGARVRRIAYARFVSKSSPATYYEHCLACLSNLGDLSVYSLPALKRQVQIQCMKQQDINAITSFVFSRHGQAFYLQSPSEFVHISMSARDSPPPPPPPPPAPAPQQQQQQQQQQQNAKKQANSTPTANKATPTQQQQQQQQQTQIKTNTSAKPTTPTTPTTTTAAAAAAAATPVPVPVPRATIAAAATTAASSSPAPSTNSQVESTTANTTSSSSSSEPT